MPVQKKTLKIKLAPDSKAKHAFEKTMCTFGQACNYISGIAHEHRCYNKVALSGLLSMWRARDSSGPSLRLRALRSLQ